MATSSTNLETRLASILGPAHIDGDPATLAAYAIDDVIPSAVAKPATAEDAAEIVRFAIAENLAIIPVGSRSKLAIGMPPARYDIAMDMTALNQIVHYDPGDLTLSADTGCNLMSLSSALTPQKQFLPFSYEYGAQSTVGGIIASGVDSYLRQFYGTPRDFLIGAEFIDGTGAQCKSGGRVVKNVTGYDLHKLLIGSLGTLAIITRLNFRTFPMWISSGSQSETFFASFPNAQSAVDFRQKIAASPFTSDSVEILSPEIIKIVVDSFPMERKTPPDAPSEAWRSLANWRVAIHFHGTDDLIARYQTALKQLSESAGAFVRADPPSNAIKTEPAAKTNFDINTGDVVFLDPIRRLRLSSPDATIFKIAQLPTKLPELFTALANIANQTNIPHALFARGLGITYFALLPKSPNLSANSPQPHPAAGNPATIAQLAQAATAIFTFCAKQSATASIQFCPTPLKHLVNVFGPARLDASAMHRLKSAFDPHNLFAPNRLPL